METDPTLLRFAIANAAVAFACALLLAWPASPLSGLHPAMKPMKFAISIALFLGTMAVLVPKLSVGPGVRGAIAWSLALTMLTELAIISAQAVRGAASHFNTTTALSSVLWRIMGAGIVIALLVMCAVTVVATVRPLRATTSPMVLAWRAGLWLFQLSAISGVAMGGRSQHTVGAIDGGPGLPVTGWSTTHGDLRVPHFIALHALQLVPLLTRGVLALPLAVPARWAASVAVIAIYAGAALWTLVRAFAGQPVW